MQLPFKPMLASLASDLPDGHDWIFEIKYDGYRCIALWSESGVQLFSRNGHSFNHSFPEVVNAFMVKTEQMKPFLPLVLDGELCILESPYKASFEALQKRGRLKEGQRIKKAAVDRPSTYLVFDVLSERGVQITEVPLKERKKKLKEIFKTLATAENKAGKPLACIDFHSNGSEYWELAQKQHSEGLIAKRCKSKYIPGVRTDQWVKIKNPKSGVFFITAYDKNNGYFHVGALRDGKTVSAGLFSHGLTPEERSVLIEIIKKNKTGEDRNFIIVTPSICVELQYLELYKDQLRHPRFVAFRLDVRWEDCTWEKAVSSKN
ncbi:non-homologous end-joining DNA ligase [Fictibacillus terranigra]|uniref:Non-homologous end-joining DNA ligase n=1 Tax=Fictibacillus terranigra TaxID=3058424 RepID=A0ABT8E765_9BACL|nr:non-homologous end-joining DNA ligase [Fictibacillus sp. CENA-BCM004]MDN4073740.1 non-homologous end-joining DNA ligase [Fictibacillus sp. CENA-BCM004]